MLYPKIIKGIGLSIVLTLVLTSCGHSSEGHSHPATTVWDGDYQYHWQAGKTADEKVDKEKHILNGDNVCEVCAAEVKKVTSDCTCPDCNEPDSYLVSMYDDRGNVVRQADYDLQGNMEEFTYERLYDERYRLKCVNTYYSSNYSGAEYDHMLCEVENYLPLASGDVYKSERILYDFDGSKIVVCYDEQSQELFSTDYDADGNITRYEEQERLIYHISYDEKGKAEYKSEYEYDAEGNVVKSVTKHYGVVEEMIEYGEAWTVARKTYYNEDGTVKREENYKDNGDVAIYRIYSYDQKGNLTRCVEHPGGGSRRKVTDYALNAKGNTYVLREAVFNEKVGDITETTYDAAGNVVKQETLPDWGEEY